MDSAQITQAFQSRGFKLVSLAEPTFGLAERQIFEDCGKLDVVQFRRDSSGHLCTAVTQTRNRPAGPQGHADWGNSVLQGARCALAADTAVPVDVSIVGECIQSIQDQPEDPFVGDSLDLSGYLLLPGLINAHDHLEFSLYPNIGDGPYYNAAQWARDIHANRAALIARHRKVPRSTSLWWGAIRNLLCGVTTVCHHNPVYPELTGPGSRSALCQSSPGHTRLPSTHCLPANFAECPADLPFILHAAEGVDEGSAQEIFELDRIHALDHRTVLVHGLACTPEVSP
jgi:hypothetical protein